MRNPVIAVLLFVFTLLPNEVSFAQIYKKLHDFDNTNGNLPYSKLIGDGTYLYGMTQLGGVNNKGTVFKIKKDGTDFQKLHDFDGTDGASPYNSLTLVGSELFGATNSGGTNNYGVIFKINIDGTGFVKILDISSQGWRNPKSSLYYDGTYLYGTTNQGGFYKIKPDGTEFTKIYTISSGAGSGSGPQGDLEFDGTYFYGSYYIGGAYNEGALFRVKPDGTGHQIIHSFENVNIEGNFNTGSMGLLLYNGYLYGNTFTGGDNSVGFIYRIRTDGTEYQILHSFGIEVTTGNKALGELIAAGDYLYGTTSRNGDSGGANSLNGTGSVFRIKPDGTDYSSFNVNPISANGGYTSTNGRHPWCGLYYDNNSLYGVAAVGGNNGRGTVFRFNDDNVPLSAVSSFSKKDISLFPNPAKTVLYIDTAENTSVKIMDISGKIVSTQKLNKGINEINVNSLTSGVYFVQTETGFITKFVKE